MVYFTPSLGGREMFGISRPPKGEGVKMLVFHALPGRGGRETFAISRPPRKGGVKTLVLHALPVI